MLPFPVTIAHHSVLTKPKGLPAATLMMKSGRPICIPSLASVYSVSSVVNIPAFVSLSSHRARQLPPTHSTQTTCPQPLYFPHMRACNLTPLLSALSELQGRGSPLVQPLRLIHCQRHSRLFLFSIFYFPVSPLVVGSSNPLHTSLATLSPRYFSLFHHMVPRAYCRPTPQAPLYPYVPAAPGTPLRGAADLWR